jgi:hypothetical protein
MSAPAPSTVIEVVSPSAAVETGLVVRAVFHIAFWSAILVALMRPAPDTVSGGLGLQYDEVGFAALPPAEQRVFRLLREGVSTAERTRARTGAWPEVAALVGRGVAPFVDPIDTAGYAWTRVAAGTTVNYLGVPAAASGLGTFLVVVLEPEPGAPPDPTAVPDDVHHLLSDGTMVHVMIWRAPGVRTTVEPVPAPRVEDGWRRVVIEARRAP